RPQKATPECISDSTSFARQVSRKSLNFRLVSRYVLTGIGSRFLPTISPSWTDQRCLCPSQPSRSLPLKSVVFSDSPWRGGTAGAPFLSLSAAGAPAEKARPKRRARAGRGVRFMVFLTGSRESRGRLTIPAAGARGNDLAARPPGTQPGGTR